MTRDNEAGDYGLARRDLFVKSFSNCNDKLPGEQVSSRSLVVGRGW